MSSVGAPVVPNISMARTGVDGFLCRRNSKLDSFLKRNTDSGVYERIRAYEPCVVVSESVNKVFMHVVLSDDCVYLAEYPPRTLTTAVNFRHIRDIELVNDLPEFLSGRDRERSQHIRVVYSTSKPSGKENKLVSGEPRFPPVLQHRLISTPVESVGGRLLSTGSQLAGDGWNVSPFGSRTSRKEEEEEDAVLIPRTGRSASCPNPEALGLTLPRPLLPPPATESSSLSQISRLSPVSTSSPGHGTQRSTGSPLVPRRRGSMLARLLKRERVVREKDGGMEEEEKAGERESELHLYAVSPVSRIYLHLLSSWNSYIIRSTLLLDPVYRRRCTVMLDAYTQKQPPISWERTAHLFGQMSSELLQEGISLEAVYLLVQELHTAAHRNITLRKLFWRSGDMFPYLVQKLEDSVQSCQRPEANTADSLLLCTLICQTLALMFGETEIEPARIDALMAEHGALTARLLLALVCNPEIQSQDLRSFSPNVSQDSRQSPPPHKELQGLLDEYMDAACSLLFELLVLCQEASRTSSREHFLTVGWILGILQPHPYLLSFVGHQARQVVVVVSESPGYFSPCQAVLLYQRCKVLLAFLKYSSHLSHFLQREYSEDFRYYLKLHCVEEKLLHQYPISQPVIHLVSQLLGRMLQKP